MRCKCARRALSVMVGRTITAGRRYIDKLRKEETMGRGNVSLRASPSLSTKTGLLPRVSLSAVSTCRCRRIGEPRRRIFRFVSRNELEGRLNLRLILAWGFRYVHHPPWTFRFSRSKRRKRRDFFLKFTLNIKVAVSFEAESMLKVTCIRESCAKFFTRSKFKRSYQRWHKPSINTMCKYGCASN